MQPSMRQLATIFSYALTTTIFLSACNSSDDPATPSTDDLTKPSSLRVTEFVRNRADGSVQTFNFVYAEDGNLLKETVRTNGEVKYEYTYEVNNLGQFTRRSEDIDQDGNEDQSSTYYYKSGLGLSEIHRVNAENLIYSVDTFQFDGNLAISRERRSFAPVASPELVDLASGTLVLRLEINYIDNRVSSVDFDSDGDGTNDLLETYQYNPDGTLATTSVTSATEGAVSTATYTYETGACNYNSDNSILDFYCINGDK